MDGWTDGTDREREKQEREGGWMDRLMDGWMDIYAGPLADSHEIKGFFIKAIFGKIKVASLKF